MARSTAYSSVNRDSLMAEKLRRRVLHIGRHYGVGPFTHVTVATIMTATVDELPAEATIGDARQRLTAAGHGAYPIVSDGRLLGIVTRSDLLRADGDHERGIDHASREVVTVTPDDTAQTALRTMVEEHVEHVPVVIDDDRLVGICTRTDLLKVRRRELDAERPQVGLGGRVAARRARHGGR